MCLEECAIVEEEKSETMKKVSFEFGNTFCYVTKCCCKRLRRSGGRVMI